VLCRARHRALDKAALIADTAAALEPLGQRDRTNGPGIPLLLTRGEHEDAVIARMIAAWAARDLQAQSEIIPGAGHLANQADPEAFNDALLRFLRQHLPTPVAG
jgi:pimeloyl-ACP methyl ester carboxylesterase